MKTGTGMHFYAYPFLLASVISVADLCRKQRGFQGKNRNISAKKQLT